MTRKKVQSPGPVRAAIGALALVILLALGAPQAAEAANTTADATILNVVRVDYKDASGNNAFAATASATVTINLVEAALSDSAPPAKDTGIPGAPGCPPAGTYESGSTVPFLYALTATANGDDIYTLTKTVGTITNATNVTVTMSTLDYLGNIVTDITTGGVPRTFGSAIPVGYSGDDTLLFPGGALAGFEANDIVIVDIAGTKTAFLVDTVTVGSAASHDNAGNLDHTDVGSDTAETQGSLKLKAFPNQSVVINGTTFDYGGSVAPAFGTTAPTLGVPVGEMVLTLVQVQASADTHGADGTVEYTLTATDGSNVTTITCTAGNFEGVGLSIKKEVRNATASGSFGATATGNPGEVLEYQVTVSNNRGTANSVEVTDAVPAYTTLVVSGGNFATISDDGGSTSVTVTTATDSESQPNAGAGNETGFGDAAGTTAGSAINFFIGKNSASATGGTVNKDAAYIIKYQVQID